MKILRVISSVNPAAGGPINGLVNSSNELSSLGHKIEVLALDDPQESWVQDFQYPLVSFKSQLGTYSYSNAFYKWLEANVTTYDVVIIHGLWQFHSYTVAKVCKNHNVPYVIFTHGMLDPWFNIDNKLKTLKKRVYWQLFERYAINNADAVLFTSEEEKSLARIPFAPYYPKERVVAYGSPLPDINVDEVKLSFNKLYPDLNNKKIALFLSRIHVKKGIDVLIDALGEIKNLPDDFVLAIAGPDSNGLQAKLTKQIEQLGLTERVVWLGMLQGDVKWGAYHAAECFILPSHQENFGIVVAEALSTATPVLITNKVNIWREIESEQAGFVANDDIAGIKSLLQQWFELTTEDMKEMSENASLCYQNNFSIEAAASDLENVLLEVIERK
jgi:glycosyltransferase involved in cell wall biosynthesis